MNFFSGVFVIAVIFAAIAQSSSDYSYLAQDQWPGECTTGRKQSPINIDTDRVQCSSYLKPLLLSHEYYTPISGTWENKGHTVQFTLEPGTNAYMLTPIGTYRLLQVHMHWARGAGRGSEHYVNGASADYEVHFVHRKVDAVDETDCDYYAVLGVRGYSSSSASMSGIFTQLNPANVKTYRSSTQVSNVDLSSLLPGSLAYYHYQGSLTTPDCYERVQWFLLKSTTTAPLTYLENLRKIQDNSGAAVTWNYRYVQSINGRIVTQVGDYLTHSYRQCAYSYYHINYCTKN